MRTQIIHILKMEHGRQNGGTELIWELNFKPSCNLEIRELRIGGWIEKNVEENEDFIEVQP